MSTGQTWSPGQRALLRFLEREGLVQGLPQPPPGDGVPDADRLFDTVAALVPPRVLAELLAARLHLPVLESDGEVDASATELLAAAVAVRCGMVPVALTGQTLEVATANPLDLDAVKTVEFATGKRVRVRVATPDTVRRALGRLYGDEAAPPPPAEPSMDPPEPPAAAAPASPPAVDAGAGATGPPPEPATTEAAERRAPRVLVLVADPVERDRLGGAVRDGESTWLVVTARDAGEGALVAGLVRPDVVIVDSAAARDRVAGDLAPCPLLVADDCGSVDDVLALARTLIDTARCG